MGYNMSNDVPLGQLGSGYVTSAGDFYPPVGKVIIAITVVSDLGFNELVAEIPTDATYKGASSSAGVPETSYFGTEAQNLANGADDPNVGGTASTSEVVPTSDIFPKGLTIYGRWTKADISTAVAVTATGAAIFYFGY